MTKYPTFEFSSVLDKFIAMLDQQTFFDDDFFDSDFFLTKEYTFKIYWVDRRTNEDEEQEQAFFEDINYKPIIQNYMRDTLKSGFDYLNQNIEKVTHGFEDVFIDELHNLDIDKAYNTARIKITDTTKNITLEKKDFVISNMPEIRRLVPLIDNESYMIFGKYTDQRSSIEKAIFMTFISYFYNRKKTDLIAFEEQKKIDRKNKRAQKKMKSINTEISTVSWPKQLINSDLTLLDVTSESKGVSLYSSSEYYGQLKDILGYYVTPSKGGSYKPGVKCEEESDYIEITDTWENMCKNGGVDGSDKSRLFKDIKENKFQKMTFINSDQVSVVKLIDWDKIIYKQEPKVANLKNQKNASPIVVEKLVLRVNKEIFKTPLNPKLIPTAKSKGFYRYSGQVEKRMKNVFQDKELHQKLMEYCKGNLRVKGKRYQKNIRVVYEMIVRESNLTIKKPINSYIKSSYPSAYDKKNNYFNKNRGREFLKYAFKTIELAFQEKSDAIRIRSFSFEEDTFTLVIERFQTITHEKKDLSRTKPTV